MLMRAPVRLHCLHCLYLHLRCLGFCFLPAHSNVLQVLECGMSPGVSQPTPFPLFLWLRVQGQSSDAVSVLPKGVTYPSALSSFDGGGYVILFCDPPQLLVCGFDGPPCRHFLTNSCIFLVSRTVFTLVLNDPELGVVGELF